MPLEQIMEDVCVVLVKANGETDQLVVHKFTSNSVLGTVWPCSQLDL